MMGKEKNKEEVFVCPVGKFFSDLERLSPDKSKFFKHLNQSRVEFLKAVRSLIDERIENIEKKHGEKGGKKATKIKVE
jgi:hypothetical protein